MKAVKRDARAMQDSGIEWIGEIPITWTLDKLKHYGTFSSNGVDKLVREGELPFKAIHYTDVYHNYLHEIGYSDSYLDSSATEDKSKDLILKTGDVLFTTSSETSGDIGKSTVIKENLPHCLFGYHLMRFRPYNNKLSLHFEKYLLGSPALLEFFSIKARGFIRYGISRSAFTEALLPFPDIQEQQIIADYLDDRCAKIDAIIAEAKASIEEYKELKQAVIYEAVTKGLDKNVAMKDSFEKWIGKYPAHYQLIQVSRLATIVRGGSPRPAGDPRYYGGDIPFLKIADVTKDEKMYVYECKNTITYAGLSRTRTIQANTLLLTNSGATLGIPKITTFKTTFNDGIAAFLDLSDKLVMEFAYYFLKARTKYYQEYASMGMGQPNLNTNIIGRTHIVLPPLNEQKEIVEYLNHITQNIDELITQKQSLIEDLESYKKSLIYEVVTGKRKVVD